MNGIGQQAKAYVSPLPDFLLLSCVLEIYDLVLENK